MKSFFCLLSAALLLSGCVSVTYRQLYRPEGVTLAEHQTIARLEQFVEEPCRHLTAQCPDACDHGGTYAIFKIERYEAYTQFTQDGEARQETFALRTRLRNGEPAPETPPALVRTLHALRPGAKVQLHWIHFYHITERGNTPERIVTLLSE